MDRTQFLTSFIVALAVAACGGSDSGHNDNNDDAIDVADVVFVPDVGDVPDTRDVSEVAVPDADATVACESAGAIGCACTANAECNSNVCIEGPDGNVCTRTCIEDCPEGYDCLATAIGGGDPISICVPRHTRLCRPCEEAADCKNPLDANPAACVPDADLSVGSFCATSCAQLPCPTGYACEDVAVGEGSARLCMKQDGECECRPAWTALGLTTSCANAGEGGSCNGTRTCTAEGLTACSATTPATEICNGIDDDCNGTTDDLAATPCTIENDIGSCAGVFVCNGTDQVCAGTAPHAEACNGQDDDCNGQTDESWNNCLPSGCNESDGVFVETGDPSCVNGQCAYTNPRPCGLYACVGGGDEGDTCASSCVDDATCVAAAHCDEGSHTCVPDVQDGSVCGDSTDCVTGHCQNGFCCAGGDCCKQPADCPLSYRASAHCDSAAQCQGARHDAACVDSVCATSEPIADDSGCGSETLAVDCTPNAPRYCNGLASQSAPTCATSCVSDAECASGFHCDGTCIADTGNGSSCDEDTDCASDHCENNFCCNQGACCAVANDCPDTFRDPATCLDAFACQGERIDATCLQNTCDSQTVTDDSGCDANVEANGCGPFAAVFCSGATVQSPPQCGFSCTTDSQCDSGFHCDVICVPNLPDGNFCDESSDCVSAHCANGLCCGSGDCCNLANDCPSSYTGTSVCDNPGNCQGTRDGALCSNHICSTVPGVGDDSACTSTIIANTCGPYPSVRCVGGATQQPPVCANSCTGNGECDADYYCNNGTCQPKKEPGTACTDSAQCGTGHCQNGFCCGSGDCCASKNDCSPAVYGTASVCFDGPSCQGNRKEPACSATFQCAVGATVNDDSGCAGFEADTCGYFESVFCSPAQIQPSPSCLSVCTSDNQCDNGAHCEGGQCVPDQGVGGLCEVSNQCSNGLACVDQRCCESSCTGVCRRCDAADAPGVCSIPAEGLDPDNECGAVSCTGYYWGFTGQTCFARGNITADVAACDSDGGCQTASDICPTAAKGASTLTCHATCQVPAESSCEGTTPGACTNVSGGTQTCGVGECANTIDKCTGGAPATCTPKLPGVEICDGKDNDCDGLTDAADPNMQLVACDNQLGVCSGSVKPASLCVQGAWQPCTNAIYLAHSSAYQAGSETTCDGGAGVDNDCDGAADDDFTYVSPAGTSVRGAGKPCGVGACQGGTTTCGVNNTLVCSSDGFIKTEICDGIDNDCDNKADSLDPSLQLILCQNQVGICNGSMRTANLCAAGSWQNCGATQYEAFDSRYEADETLCDGLDNDCNTLIDDGLNAPLNSNQQGVCAGSRQVCNGTNGFGDSYTAAIPFYNANETLPDGNFRDENCDGVDGNVNLAWFVSPTGAGTTCSRAAPCALTTALGATARNHIYLRTGTYSPPGGTTFNLSRVVKMFGGYGNDTNWTRAQRSSNPATITGGQFSGEAITMRVAGIGSAADPVVFGDLIFNGGAPSGAGKSSYVIWAKSARISVERSTISAANGAAGASGGAGTNAASLSAPGAAGNGTGATTGFTFCNTDNRAGGGRVSNSCSDGGTTRGGNGGEGGGKDSDCGWCGCNCGSCTAENGTWGEAGLSSGASPDGGGGSAGGGGSTCGAGGNGGGGGVSNGARGFGASNAFGTLSADLFAPASGGDGGVGSHGGGGGGGGGSGGCDAGTDSTGAGGGGGGAGGCRARQAGTGGGGGGGSFGLFAIDTFATVVDSTFSRGVGGAGGSGGSGGRGQPGGAGGRGGDPDNDSRGGGDGGDGGEGGHSGAGGGGAGGPSYGIFWSRSTSATGSLANTNNAFGTTGSGGSKGAAGSGWISATNGTAGVDGDARPVCERNGNNCL